MANIELDSNVTVRQYKITGTEFYIQIVEDKEGYQAWIGEKNHGIESFIIGSEKNQQNCKYYEDGIQTYEEFLKIVLNNLDEDILSFMHEMEEYDEFCERLAD